MRVFNRKAWNGYGQLIMVFLVFSPFVSAHAQSYNAQTRQEITVDEGLVQGLHQHNANTALLVSGLGSSFGIHRYDLANNRLELLKTITPRPLIEHVTVLDDGLSFHTTESLTFIDIRGRLYSSDATRENTQFIRDFGVGFGGGSLGAIESGNIGAAHSMGKQLLFSAHFQVEFDNTVQLFVSDGSRAGTKQLGPNFASIGLMFSVDNETFFFGKANETDNLQIWQVSENGTRLSKILTTAFKFGPFSNVINSNNIAYFCLGDQLASFSNKRLNFTSSVSCDIESSFIVNRSGFFFTNQDQGNIFRLNTETLEVEVLFISETDLPDLSMCSTDDSLIFTEGTGKLFSYSTDLGLQQLEIRKVSSLTPDIICFKDKAIVLSLDDGNDSIYRSDLNTLLPIRRSFSFTGFDYTSNAFNRNNGPTISFNDKIYALNFQTFARSHGNIVEISEQAPFFTEQAPFFTITPIITELLLEQ